jgi:hypothetical protein
VREEPQKSRRGHREMENKTKTEKEKNTKINNKIVRIRGKYSKN